MKSSKWQLVVVPLGVIVIALAIIGLGHILHPAWVGEQNPVSDYLRKTVGLITDAPHATAELFYSAIENVLIVIVGYQWGKRAIAREHAKLDAEHGIEHD